MSSPHGAGCGAPPCPRRLPSATCRAPRLPAGLSQHLPRLPPPPGRGQRLPQAAGAGRGASSAGSLSGQGGGAGRRDGTPQDRTTRYDTIRHDTTRDDTGGPPGPGELGWAPAERRLRGWGSRRAEGRRVGDIGGVLGDIWGSLGGTWGTLGAVGGALGALGTFGECWGREGEG